MVSDLITQYSGQFSVVTFHIDDVYTVPWGQNRFSNYYSLVFTPTLMIDGELNCPTGNYAACLDQAVGNSTDVTIELSGSQDSGATWDIVTRVCIESGGSNRSMTIHTAATLNDHPDLPPYTSNVLMQDALTEDVSLTAGNCQTVNQSITFDSLSWSNKNNITIVAWAQDPGSSGPATAYQSATMDWPFPAGSELTSIEITPADAEIAVGDSMTYTATGKDQNGSGFELTNPVWYTTGDGYGAFDPESGSNTPDFTAERPGSAEVVCTQGGITGRTSLEITGDPAALASIVVLPASVELEVGQSRSFTAIGYDQYGDEFPLSAPSWSVTGDGSGTFDPSGGTSSTTFTATRPGSAAIVCSDGDASGQTAILITGDAPQLAEIAITPTTAMVALGSSKLFTASGTDQYGEPYTMDSLVWSVSGDGNGTFDPDTGSETTTFTATAEGVCTVTAAQDGIEAEAAVEVAQQGLPKPRRIKARHTP